MNERLTMWWKLTPENIAVPVNAEIGSREWCEAVSFIEKNPLLMTRVGPFRVSSIFLGLDHSWGFSDHPILFETMVFDDSDRHPIILDGKLWCFSSEDLEQRRYGTYQEMVEDHERIVAKMKAAVEAATGQTIEAVKVRVHG